MLSRLFDLVTRLSVRWRIATIAFTLAILVAGGIAYTQLNQELLPPIEFPQTIVVAQWADSESAETLLDAVTIPLEEALAGVDGVVNIESTTNPTFAFIIVRNEFGLNQDVVAADIEGTIDALDLPEGTEADILRFSFSDLPVVVASVSSGTLTLDELKAIIETDLQQALAEDDIISEVSVAGGQALPEDAAAALAEGGEEPAAETPEPTATPVPLSELTRALRNGLRLYGFDVQYAQDITEAQAVALAGLGQLAMAPLNELTPENLRAIAPNVLAYLPTDYTDTLPADLFNELNALAADYGGIGQFSLSEAVAAKEDGVNVLTGQPLDADEIAQLPPTPTPPPTATPAPTPTPEAAVAAAPAVTPVALPESWVAAGVAAGVPLSTTADVSADVMTGLITFAPELRDDLTPTMWRALEPAAIAAAWPEAGPRAGDTLTPTLALQLDAIVAAGLGQAFAVDEPLPPSWVEAAVAGDLAIATTADVTPELLAGFTQFAPQLFADLTITNVLSLTPAAQAALPADYVAGLDADTQETLAIVQIRAAGGLLARAGDGEDEGEADAVPVEGAPLPPSWVQGAAAAGLDVQVAEQMTPDFLQGIGQFAPELFDELTPEMVLAFPPAAQAALPADFVAGLDADTQAALAESIAAADLAPADPNALPDFFVQGAAQAGVELETAADITPDLIRLFAGLGEQGVQALSLLTPDNLRLLPAESIALLPVELLDALDADLRAELDELAAEFGGAGTLLLAEQEAAAALAAGAPPLSGVWLEPGPEGEPPQYETAADIVANPFGFSAGEFLNGLPNSPLVDDPRRWLEAFTPMVIDWIVEQDAGFIRDMDATLLELFPADSIAHMLDAYPDAFDADLADRLAAVAAGDVAVFVPEASITRKNGDPSVLLNVYKVGGANTVVAADRVFEAFESFERTHPGVDIEVVFEQATFITDSIEGVSREGALGALFAVIVILIFLSGRVSGRYRLSWRATLITGLSIPASILFAFLLMRWLPGTVGVWLDSAAARTGNGVFEFLARLIPNEITLNIMTLSGLTVAIGRVVDDSIVVLENSYRYIQKGEDPVQAVFKGTREVAVAIFAATLTTMAVFLPLGLVGGLIGEFFLPFGLTVTYALVASYIVSITVVPALTVLFIRKENIPEERETALQRWYTPVLEWTLNHRGITLGLATVVFVGSLFLLGRLPNSFIPSLGEPTINVGVQLEPGTAILDTNAVVETFETELAAFEGIETVLTEVGSGGGFEALFGGGGVTQNNANLTISVTEDADIDALAEEVRRLAQRTFGEDAVTVSAASQAGGGFGGFQLIVTDRALDGILPAVDDVVAALEALDADGDGRPDLLNVTSNAEAALEGSSIIRIDGRPAISFSAELNTADTIGVTSAAQTAIAAVGGLPASAEVSEGFDSQQQTEGFQDMIFAIGVAIVVVYLIMAIAFGSPVHPFTILFSLPFALVGASVALFITNSVLGISAMVGMLMLVGVVVTNGIVLMELVQQLRQEGAATYDALVEAGRTRLRPIWMTALTAILALIPLATSTEGGAIIAAELGTTVIGGLTVSTALTLIVIPVVYSLLDQLVVSPWQRRFGRGRVAPAGD